jgi:uncharacterized membrane protein YkvA (DUF1232 family)
MRSRQKPDAPTKQELKAGLIPIVKRTPAYMKLALLLAKEPSIPLIHRSGLYVTVVYIVSPAHLVVSAIPVLGQIDVIGMLFLSIRQALNHCPQETMERLCSRVRLAPQQLNQDMITVKQLTNRGTSAMGYAVCDKVNKKAPCVAAAGRSVSFAGKVANGFTRRVVRRMRTA